MANKKRAIQKKTIEIPCPKKKCGGTARGSISYPSSMYRTMRNAKHMLYYFAKKLKKATINRLLEKYKIRPWPAYNAISGEAIYAKKLEKKRTFKCDKCGYTFVRTVKINSKAMLQKKIKRFFLAIKDAFSMLPEEDRYCYFSGKKITVKKVSDLFDDQGTNKITWHHEDGNRSNNRPDNLWLAYAFHHRSSHHAIRMQFRVLKRELKKKLGDIVLQKVLVAEKNKVKFTISTKTKVSAPFSVKGRSFAAKIAPISPTKCSVTVSMDHGAEPSLLQVVLKQEIK